MRSALDVVEVSPRDGLQNESVVLPTAAKVRLVEHLVAAGARRVEAVSFAHPRRVPAMADAEAVMAAVPRREGLRYAGLVLNRKGLDRALACGVDEVNVVVCASDTFSRRNQNASTEEAMAAAEDVVDAARAAGLLTTVTVATAFGCPFEGGVARERVVGLAVRAVEAGADEVCFADTTGVGVPTQVHDLTAALRDADGGRAGLRFHFHDTRATGMANAYAALLEGADALDSSAGGIGGCPFAPAATGNIATDDLVHLLERMGVATGIDLAVLLPTAAYLAQELGHPVPAMLPRAGVPDPPVPPTALPDLTVARTGP